MPTRRRSTQAVAWLLAAGAALAVSTAYAQNVDDLRDSRFIERHERLEVDGSPPLELKFLIVPEAAWQDARIVNTTRATLTMLSEWFGPPPFSALTVAGVGWRPGQIPESVPGTVSTTVRWLTSSRDRATERQLIRGIAHQYWNGGAPADGFIGALVTYVASRATHHQLEGSNFATPRFFGGIVPFSLRSVLLSPPVADPRPRVIRFEYDRPLDADQSRQLRALQTIERYVGWPTMLQAVSRLRGRPAPLEADALAQALSDARGTDLRLLIDECFRADAVFDYALADLRRRAVEGGLIETSATIVRHGPGMFTTGGSAAERSRIVPLRVRFADGTEIRDLFDGAAPSVSPVYTARTAAVSATVDPDVMLLLDVNRENNTIVRDARISPLGVRLAFNWITWLQQTMLSYTAIL